MYLFYGAVWIILCFISGLYGRDRKTGIMGTFIISIFLSPIIVMMALIFMDKFWPLQEVRGGKWPKGLNRLKGR